MNGREEIKSIKKLWLAVIEQAVLDYRHDPSVYTRKQEQRYGDYLRRSAALWLFYSEQKSIGSLHWICEVVICR